jgi:hypothetical protein
MKSFIDRLVVGEDFCQYTKGFNKMTAGSEMNFNPGQIGFRFCGFSKVCHVLSAFWNCICELMSVPDTQLSSIVLSMPAIAESSGQQNIEASRARFVAVAQLVSRSLCLSKGDDVFEFLHFNPNYNRSLVFPSDAHAHGHLPPFGWTRAMLSRSCYLQKEQGSLSDERLNLSNSRRRSPFTAVVIKRVKYLE